MNKTTQLGEEKISTLLIKFSIPAITGMLVKALYNVVDRAFVGRGVGSLGIAGVTVVFPLMMFLVAFGMLIGLGGGALCSLYLGRGEKEQANVILGNVVILDVVVIGTLCLGGLYFMEPILELFGASELVMPYAKDYFRIILWGGIFNEIGFGVNNFIRAEGNPLIAMCTMLIGGILNIVLDPLFIFVFDLGIKGAAWATVISQIASSIWVMHYFLRGNSVLKIYKKNLRLRVDIVKKIIKMGSAPFAMQIAASSIQVILNNILGIYGGDLAISGVGIINSFMMAMQTLLFGINHAAQPIIGFNYGARKYERVKETLKLAIFAGTFIVSTTYILLKIFPTEIITLFNRDNQELIEFGSRAIQIFLFALPVVGFQIVSANYFQAVGKPYKAMILSLSRQVIIFLPAVLILPKFWGLDGVLLAQPVADITAAILTGILLIFEVKRLDQDYKSTNSI